MTTVLDGTLCAPMALRTIWSTVEIFTNAVTVMNANGKSDTIASATTSDDRAARAGRPRSPAWPRRAGAAITSSACPSGARARTSANEALGATRRLRACPPRGDLAELREAAFARRRRRRPARRPARGRSRGARRAGDARTSSIGPLGRPTPSRRAPQRTTNASAQTASSVTNVSMRYPCIAGPFGDLRATLLQKRDRALAIAPVVADGRRGALLNDWPLAPIRKLPRGPHRPEVRRHLGRLDRAHPQRRARGRSPRSAQGNDVVVIVSAMSGETNRLLRLAHEVVDGPRRARDGRHRRDRRAGRPPRSRRWPSRPRAARRARSSVTR